MSLYHGRNKIGNIGVKFEYTGGMNTSDATIESGAQMLNGVTAYGKNGKVTGTIPSQPAKTITPNNEEQIAIAKGTYAEGAVTVSAVPTETKNISVNGTYTPQDGKYFSSISVNVAGENFETQSKTVAPTEVQQTVSPDNGYDGLSSVIIEAIPTSYVGSEVPREGNIVVTPDRTTQFVVSPGTYVEGSVVVDIIPSEYVATADATAVASDILSGKTAYVNGEKVYGTFVAETINLDAEITTQDSIISQIQAALEDKTSNDLDTSDATATAEDIATGKTAYVNGEKITGTHECAGGGAAVDTCTLNLTYSVLGTSHPITVSVLNNGVISSSYTTISSAKTIQNVICGSCAVITPPVFGEFVDNVILIDGVENSIDDSYHTVFEVPYKKDGVVEIEITTSDTQDN